MDNIKMDFWGEVKIEKMFDIHDNQKVVICTNGGDNHSKDETSPKNHCGRPKESLFIDDETKIREKERLNSYLPEHKMSKRSLTCNQNDTLNDVVTCFLMKWIDLGYATPSFSGGAVFRFLTETCGLQSEVTDKSYGNEIKERLRKKNYTFETMRKVNSFF